MKYKLLLAVPYFTLYLWTNRWQIWHLLSICIPWSWNYTLRTQMYEYIYASSWLVIRGYIVATCIYFDKILIFVNVETILCQNIYKEFDQYWSVIFLWLIIHVTICIVAAIWEMIRSPSLFKTCISPYKRINVIHEWLYLSN